VQHIAGVPLQTSPAAQPQDWTPPQPSETRPHAAPGGSVPQGVGVQQVLVPGSQSWPPLQGQLIVPPCPFESEPQVPAG
jgi:hypothetical protein